MDGIQDYKEQPKKKFKIKIAGFTIKLGHIVAFALVVGIIAISSLVQKHNADKEAAEAAARRQAEIEAALSSVGEYDASAFKFDIHEQIQSSLAEEFGSAPEGFEWGYTGELVALGNDDDHTCEDVTYMFLRALSILDFSTAQRYSSDSAIISDYQNMYGLAASAVTDYYRNFLRKQFKLSLTSLEIDRISDTAVFADGTEYISIDVLTLDLTDKDFWRDDRDWLFDQLYVFRETEADNTKIDQYIYDYIFSKYEDGSVGKKAHSIELVVSKTNGLGWLISGDKELSSYLQYEYGVDVASYIQRDFEDYCRQRTLEEQLAEIWAVTNDRATTPTAGRQSGETQPSGTNQGSSGKTDPDYDTSGDTGEYYDDTEFPDDDLPQAEPEAGT